MTGILKDVFFVLLWFTLDVALIWVWISVIAWIVLKIKNHDYD